MPGHQNEGFAVVLSIVLRFLTVIERCFRLVAVLCILGLVVVTSFDVVGRYFFNQALGWAYDTALVMMVGLCFLSASSLHANKGNVSVHLLVRKMGPSGRRYAALFHSAAGAFCYGVIGWMNTLYAIDAANSGWTYGGFGVIPTWLPYSFIGAGCLVLCARLVVEFLVVLAGDRRAAALLEF